MTFDQQVTLFLAGALTALITAVIMGFVQHWLDMKRLRFELKAQERLYERQLNDQREQSEQLRIETATRAKESAIADERERLRSDLLKPLESLWANGVQDLGSDPFMSQLRHRNLLLPLVFLSEPEELKAAIESLKLMLAESTSQPTVQAEPTTQDAGPVSESLDPSA